MTTLSDRLSLAVPTSSDHFDTGDIAQNWEKIDAFPGVFICTNGTRPTDWGANHVGMRIRETDGWEFVWDGAHFVRDSGLGFLSTATRTSTLTTSATTAQTVVQVVATVPNPGHTLIRCVRITASWPKFTAVGKRLAFSIVGSSPSALNFEWEAGADVLNDNQGDGGSMTLIDQPLAIDTWGNVTYAFKVRALAALPGAVSVIGSSGAPIRITAFED